VNAYESSHQAYTQHFPPLNQDSSSNTQDTNSSHNQNITAQLSSFINEFKALKTHSYHFSPQSLTNSLIMPTNNLQPLSIFLWNANGILQHLNELQVVLNEKKVTIALISETHLTKTSTLKIPGFDIIRADHPDGTAHGGSALLISNKIDHAPLPPYLSTNIQAASTSITINSVTISISSCYFPTGRPFPSAELGNLVQSLSFTHIIGADFNAKYQTWSRSTNTSWFVRPYPTKLHLAQSS